jgi:hypothetical protein
MPFYRFHFNTPLCPSEASSRIYALTRPKPNFFESIGQIFSSSNDLQPFMGKVEPSAFRIQRGIHGRNSFLPYVWGKIAPLQTGSRVTVNMFMHPLVIIFMVCWLSMVGYGALDALANRNANGSTDIASQIAIFLFGIGIVLVGFIPEAIKAKRILLNAVGSNGT